MEWGGIGQRRALKEGYCLITLKYYALIPFDVFCFFLAHGFFKYYSKGKRQKTGEGGLPYRNSGRPLVRNEDSSLQVISGERGKRNSLKREFTLGNRETSLCFRNCAAK